MSIDQEVQNLIDGRVQPLEATVGTQALSISDNAAAIIALANRVSAIEQGGPSIPSGPVIESASITGSTDTTISLTATLDLAGPLRSEYSTDGATWLPGPDETSYDYVTHAQTITGLAPDTEYWVRVIAYDIEGETTDLIGSVFTQSAPSASTQRTYGPAMNADSKYNVRLRGTTESNPSGELFGIRWRATTTSQLVSIAVPFRWGNGYSEAYPNWGNVRVRVMGDVNGDPDFGNIIVQRTIDPASYLNLSGMSTSAGECFYPVSFGSSGTLIAGQVYHVIFDNDDPAGGTISINISHIWSSGYGAAVARPFGTAQPRWDPMDLAVTEAASGNDFRSGANVEGYKTPIVDIAYADGTVDGWVTPHNISYPQVRDIGGSAMVRERFTVAPEDDGTVISKLWARVSRTSGSGLLTLRLETGAGVVLGEGTSSEDVIGWDRQDAWDPNGSWVSVAIAPVTLHAGQTYHLRLSAPVGTVFGSVPILWRSSGMNNHFPQSEHFAEGDAQYTTNGSTWSPMHSTAWPAHAQVFMERA